MAKIYNDFQPANLMSFAKSFARLNGQPLDKSEIWYSLAEAQAYAETDAAYVGQILAVIDSEQNNVVFYGIQNTAGLLKEVGSTPVGDNLSIEIVDNKVQVRGFGKEYYAYVPAEKDAEGNIIEKSKYVLTEGFKAGLEPRAMDEDGKLVIAWYEPGTETVEDVAANVEAVSKVVETLDETVESLDEVLNAEGGLVDQVDELKDQVGQAADDTGNAATGLYAEIERLDKVIDTKADADKVYTKEQADSAIAAAVANVDHLKREIVEALPDAVDADANTIYMVSRGLTDDDNKYYEYILINGIFEPVGSWEVDLSKYATKEEVTSLSNTVKSNKDELDEKILNLQNDLDDEIERATAAEGANATAAANALTAAQEAKTAAQEAKTAADKAQEEIDIVEEAIEGRLLSDDDKTKLEKLVLSDDGTVGVSGTINASNVKELDTWLENNSAEHVKNLTDNNLSQELAEKINFITTVKDADFVVVDGQLQLNTTDGRLITNEEIETLQAVADGDFDNYVKSVNEEIFSVIDGKLDLLVLPTELLTPVVGDMSQLINYTEGTTIVNELNNIYEMLTWNEMEEATI